ncbi:MAG TPA: preprotein translocase subunit SecG [Aliidongia sp.]|nr:preprotein translocase subunit SecG [Aliidongia sp.]
MITVILVVHVMLALSLIGVVLIQKSEGGGLGLGSGGGMSGFMTGRSTANLLTRTTAILAGCFMATSLTLAILASRQHAGGRSILDQIPVQTAPATIPSAPPAADQTPQTPQDQQSVPLAK